MLEQTLLNTLLRDWFASNASKDTTIFLESPTFTSNGQTPPSYTSATYDAMVLSFDAFCIEKSASPSLYNIRGLVTLPDGTVVYDSSKGTANTPTNARNKIINENHNTRQVIMKAILGPQGQYQYEGKYSTTNGDFESYIGTCLGGDGVTSLGCVRLSSIEK